jgi:hypothetical protein
VEPAAKQTWIGWGMAREAGAGAGTVSGWTIRVGCWPGREGLGGGDNLTLGKWADGMGSPADAS